MSQTIERSAKQKNIKNSGNKKSLGEKRNKTIKTKNERPLSSYWNFSFRSIVYFWSCK